MLSVTSSDPEENVLLRLREATAATHERMHGLAPFRRIEEQALWLSEYRRLLAALHHFHVVAQRIGRSAKLADYGSGTRRLKLLESDLGYLQVPARLFGDGPQQASEHRACGWLYVAEGSMLGGKIIARQLDYLFGDVLKGRQFFIGTPEDGRSWRLLSTLLGEMAADEDEVQQMIAGAEESFAYFASSLAEAECL